MKFLIVSVILVLPSILGAPVNDDYSNLEIRKARSPLQFPPYHYPYYRNYPIQGNCNHGGPPGPPPPFGPPPPPPFGPPPPPPFGPPPPPRHFGPPGPPGGFGVEKSSGEDHQGGGGYQQNHGDQSEKITEGHGDQHDSISADTGKDQGHGGQGGGASANANANASANSSGSASAQANAVATASADSNASASSSATANASSDNKKVCILCKITNPATV